MKFKHLKNLIVFPLLGGTIFSCNVTDIEKALNQGSAIKSTGLSSSPHIIHHKTSEGKYPLAFTHKQFSEKHSFGIAEKPVFSVADAGHFHLNDCDGLISNGIIAEVLFPEQSIV
ncbi:hypothetical protein [Echinicola sediminis]